MPRLGWAAIALVLLFLYVPLVPPFLASIAGAGPFWAAYAQLDDSPLLTGAARTTVLVGVVTAIVTPALGLLAAMAVRELRVPRLILLMVLLPLFIPGVSMGLATAFFFRAVGIPPSFLAVALVHVLWALPFATLIILTVMSTLDPRLVEAAHLTGANRLQAFRDIELPLLWPGISGAALFSLILSFNETVRTALVQGPLNTVQTYIWSSFKQVGLSPVLHALMSLLILVTLLLMLVLLVSRRAARDRPRPRRA